MLGSGAAPVKWLMSRCKRFAAASRDEESGGAKDSSG
jgi:hypothetical protein